MRRVRRLRTSRASLDTAAHFKDLAAVSAVLAAALLASLMFAGPVQARSTALVVGDSLTSGYFASTQAHAYASQVAAWLSLHGYDATTHSAYGGKVADALSTLAALQAVAPDLAVIELGTNDCSGWPGTTPTPAAAFERDYRKLMEGLRETRPGCMLVLLGVWKERNVRATYDGIIARLADEYSATYVSLEALSDDSSLSGPAGLPTFLGLSDAFHPSDEGHEAIAAAVENAVRWQCTLTLGTGTGYTRSRDVRVSLVAHDRLSLVTNVSRSANGGAWSPWRPLSAAWTWHLPAGDGRRQLAVRLKDSAGAVSLPVTTAVTLDTHGPVTYAVAPATAVHGESVAVRYRVNDGLSPTARVTIVFRKADGGVVRTSTLGARTTGVNHRTVLVGPPRAGRYRFVVRATDLAGNAQSVAGSNALIVR